jgi:uncharacterized membrane protein
VVAVTSIKARRRRRGIMRALACLMTNTPLPLVETLIVAAALAVAAWFRPWTVLREAALRSPWLAALVLLPWLWGAPRLMPGGLELQLSGACLLVLMFGWPLAMATTAAVAVLGGWLSGASAQQVVTALAWSGVVPAALALALGMATRRWLPHHLMVYILARGFMATALATAAAGWLKLGWQPLPAGGELGTLATSRWLIAWGEAIVTGMFTSIFVAFRPEWLFTYSDRRYLPK